MSSSHGSTPDLRRQPKAVWAVAFACVISFMGIGLVDPILPSMSEQLGASPSQISLLFTSYLVVTAVAMLGVGWVSSRIGSKWTLALGLAIIVVFAALAGSAGSVDGIVLFRGGWGLGNALFIATSLAVIVASASGGFSGAIILYEAALGIGIAAGPLLGGLLGHLSWRGPFFGVAVLMGIALVATLLFVPRTPAPVEKVSLAAPLRALGHRGLLTMGIVALLYNWGFFTMLGYAPYPMHLDALRLGLVFTGWGLLVALFAVVVAPRLQRRFGTVPVLYANLACLAVVMAAIAIGVDTSAVVITAVIASGACIGVNNTFMTQAVMLVSPVERSVASSAYGFVRFIGGGLAPWIAGVIADASGPAIAFVVGAAAFVIAIPVLASGHRLLAAAEDREADVEPAATGAEAGHGALELVGAAVAPVRPVVVAIDGSAAAASVVDAASSIARRDGAPLEIVHVRETDVVEELAISPETRDEARVVVEAQLARIDGTDVTASGVVLESVGDHAAAGRSLALHAADVEARCVVVGRSTGGALARIVDGSLTTALADAGAGQLVVVGPSNDSAVA
ncbi:MFS family permease [Pseudoclavibacter chungangensis]|uniref:MFS transporter n=1 Tax=Pseudoclavibacter chungangensis TaxID=587635 RepID=UPI0017B2AA58|nr:MFS transporter [Pseudoclavibacter chungangensis]NYJ67589.1 MFS family permease [Pseudoclavibacter chungangensis]